MECDSLKATLSDMFERKHVFLVGRATSAIYVALKAAGIRTGSVVLPDVLCPSPANAVLYSGLGPVFSDVNIHDYNMSVDSLNEVVDKETKAVIPVHLFGHPAKMERIGEIAKDNGLFVIEDVAQALGGEYKGKKLGSYGDVSVLSFGGKIIDGGDGGALLTDSDTLARAIEKKIEKLPPKPSNIEERYDEYKRYYYETADIRNEEKRRERFLAMPRLYKDLYLYKFETGAAKRICLELESLDENLKRRRENAGMYRKMLTHPLIAHPGCQTGAAFAVYRYSVLIKGDGNRKKVTEKLRKKGYDASNLYYVPLHEIYASGQEDGVFKNTIHVGQHILNLWVEPGITKEYIRGVCETILGALDE